MAVCILGSSDGGIRENDDERSEHLQSTSMSKYKVQEFGESNKIKRRRLAILSQIDDSAVNTLMIPINQTTVFLYLLRIKSF